MFYTDQSRDGKNNLILHVPTCFPEPTVIAVRLATAVHLIIPFWYALVEDEESLVERNGSYLTKISMARPKKTCSEN